MNQANNPTIERAHERKNVLFAANLSIGGIKVDCEIINISFGGAQVRVSQTMKPGDKVWLIPWDIGTCANLYDYAHAARDGRLEVIWDIGARGLYR